MQLDKYQRLVLLNQFSIRKYVERVDYYDDLITILSHGYESCYDDLFTNIYDSVSEDVTHLVVNTLDMFRWIRYYKELNVSDTAVSENLHSNFLGFDGTYEGTYKVYAEFIINDENRYPEYKPMKLNSHHPMADCYNRMVQVWLMDRTQDPPTKAQVDAILAAV